MTPKQCIGALAALVIATTGGAAASAHEGDDHTKKAAGHTHAAGASSLGEPGKAAEVTRTVQIDMSDNMRFKPATIEVKQGETIRFIVKNAGKVKHEMVLGTPRELKEHYAMMMKMPDMEHDEPNMVAVEPGKAGELIWRFTNARVVDFACLQPGHYGAGMKGQIKVARVTGAPATRGHDDHKH